MITKLLTKTPFFLACKESRIESSGSLYGCFYLGPFNSGQSLTIANALRRTLLSELTGIAINSVQIEGALHEYSSLNGVRESVLDIVLNLKEVILKVQIPGVSEANPKTETQPFPFLKNPQIGYLKARGPGVVRARDLKLPLSIQCVNPEQYLLTLCEDGAINLKFQIYQGKNSILKSRSFSARKNQAPDQENINSKFQTWKKQLTAKNSEQNTMKTKTSEFGKKTNLITIDSIFTPVNQVNYIIEENSPSNHTIILEIWTNGSIHPKQALFCGVNLLIKLFSRLETFRVLDSSLIEKVFHAKHLENTNINNYTQLSLSKLENQFIEEKFSNKCQNQNSSVVSLTNPLLSNREISLQKFKLLTMTKNKLNQDFLVSFTNSIELAKLTNHEKNEKEQNIQTKLKDKNNFLFLDIGILNISLRAYTCLKRAQINTIANLIEFTDQELLQLKNFGKRSLNEVEKSLNQLKLNLKSVK
nr:alpha subunit of RNA polymerase [Microspora sp. UTEX LB472]